VTQVDENPESSAPPGVLTYGTPSVGEVLAERYELQEHINNDAVGRQVWRGIDVVLRRPVAVVLRYPGGEAAVEMLDAAVSASRVVHPHLVDVYDAIDEGNRAYVVREWVDGGSLRELVSEAPLDADRATAVASAIASALAAVHATGMVHGNVHPGTVLIGSDGRVVLADARADGIATPDSDVRAVGGVLYCALTGHWPHAELGPTGLPDAVRDADGALVAPRQVRGGVPGHLSDLATDLLDPQAAPPSADVLAADLSRLDSVQQESQFFADGGPLDFDQPRFADPRLPDLPRPAGRKLAVGVIALFVLAVAGLFIASRFLPGSSSGGAPQLNPPTAGANTSQAAGKPVPVPLTANQVRVIDPMGTRSELRDIGNVVDGNPDTSWKTENYRGSANFGGIKDGMGILVNLGSPRAVASVKVSFIKPGATVELKTGSSDFPSTKEGDTQLLAAYTTLGTPKADAGSSVVLPSNNSPVQYLLIWITKLPPSDQALSFQVGVEDIQVLAS
jgi:eukaryotic-like serine/threonine-protein kinase